MLPIPSLGPDFWQDTFKELSDSQLIKRLRSVAYGAAFRNADAVATVQRKLFVERSADKFEEVLTHPVLDLLDNPNPRQSGYQFIQLSQLYLEATGKCYWRIVNNGYGLPTQLWVMQPQLVSTEQGTDGFIKTFRYASGSTQFVLSPDKVIDIYLPNLTDPYNTGYAPMQAAAELVHQNYLTREHQVALLENKAEPSAIISPKPENTMSETMMTRFVNMFRKKHRRNSGGVVGITTPVDITPISFNSRDSEFLAFYQEAKKDICMVFGVPTALMESTKSRAELEAALVQHGRIAVDPRVKLLNDTITKRLCVPFNSKLFIQSDSAAPEDQQVKAQTLTTLVAANIISADEAREKLGIEGKAPAPKADPAKDESDGK